MIPAAPAVPRRSLPGEPRPASQVAAARPAAPLSAVSHRLTIIARSYGASGQPWLWRQVTGLEGFSKRLICWERHNRDTQPPGNVGETILEGRPAPYDDEGRWLYRVRTAPQGNFYAAIGQERRRLAEQIADGAPDLLLCYFGDIAMRIMPVARQLGVPLVAYLHGDFLFATNRWYRWSFLRCFRHFAAVIVVTERERLWLLKHGLPADRIHVVPCGAPIDRFVPGTDRRGGDPTFVMASRLVKEKGCEYSIAAFSEVAKTHPGARLNIYGDGPQRAELEQLTARLGLQGRVVFHGYVDAAALAERLPAHDVFIQHSLCWEGSPVSIAEAMACGLAVVATPVGGIGDLVEDGQTGILVNVGDVLGMADAMRRLAHDAELRKSYGHAARARALLHFDSAKQTALLGRVLQDMAGAETGSRRGAAA